MEIIIEVIALIISFIAIIIALLKDFFLPWFRKPELEFEYKEKEPYRRKDVGLFNSTSKATFLRFSVKNKGKKSALNCRCQVEKVESGNREFRDYQGFPLKWASRPEPVINQASGERLNIGIGETEFIDIAFAKDIDNLIHLQKYHQVPIGIREFIEPGVYDIFLLFSGDNFKPYKLKFHIIKDDSKDRESIRLELIDSFQ